MWPLRSEPRKSISPAQITSACQSASGNLDHDRSRLSDRPSLLDVAAPPPPDRCNRRQGVRASPEGARRQVELFYEVEHLRLRVLHVERDLRGAPVLRDHQRPDSVWKVRVSAPVEGCLPDFFPRLAQSLPKRSLRSYDFGLRGEPEGLVEVLPGYCPDVGV